MNAALAQAKSAGAIVVLVTATVSHKLGDHLSDVLALLQESWSATWSGKAIQRWKRNNGHMGTIRSLEVTYGRNGWHPHVHAVIVLSGITEADAVEVCTALGRRYEQSVRSRGGSVMVRGAHAPGWDVQVVHDVESVATYVAGAGAVKGGWSVGHEMARGDVKQARKGGASPFELLSLAVAGDPAAVKLWAIYEKTMAGKRIIVWSPGMKAAFAVPELDDDDLLDVEPVEDIEAEWFVPRATWQWWVRTGMLGVKLQWFDTEPCSAENLPIRGRAPAA